MRFFRGFGGGGKKQEPVASSQIAKQRLKVVLVHDQMRMSPGLLAAVRADLVDVLSRRLDIDREGIEVTISPGPHAGEDQLTARIPIRRGPARAQR